MMTHNEWTQIADSLLRSKPVADLPGKEPLAVYFKRFEAWMVCCKNVTTTVKLMTGQDWSLVTASDSSVKGERSSV
jgi:hypothetical protein